MPYPILNVDPGSLIGDEQMGSKPKVWFRHDGEPWLFKETRPGTGEDWAEKIGAEVARLVGITAARVELATRGEKPGSASQSFLTNLDNLMHGNEVLFRHIVGYDQEKTQHQSDHTLENVINSIGAVFVGEDRLRDHVLESLCSYIVLDALIGNTDRHHENWGLIWHLEPLPDGGAELLVREAPSFDHASSLGRELTDARRQELLRNGQVGKYMLSPKARGGVYLRSEDPHGANPLRLVQVSVRLFPRFFVRPLQNLRNVPKDAISQVVDEVPDSRMSETSKDFAKAYLNTAYDELVRLI